MDRNLFEELARSLKEIIDWHESEMIHNYHKMVRVKWVPGSSGYKEPVFTVPEAMWGSDAP